MLEKLLELDDIMLYPTTNNRGRRNQERFNFLVVDETDQTASLPIFTAPMDSIVSKDNNKAWVQNHIRPILPRTEALELRLEGCQYIFTAFSLEETVASFLSRGKVQSRNQFRICIDEPDGHYSEIFSICSQLKKTYGNQMNIMAGNIGNPKTYIDYCRAGVDYVRVGFSTGSTIDERKYGFYYPLASLLIDIQGVKSTSCVGMKQPKIVADGGIYNQTDIVKALALGADYVMCGRQFARLIEAAGTLYKKERLPSGEERKEEVLAGSVDLASLGKAELIDLALERQYYPNSVADNRTAGRLDHVRSWIKVQSGIEEWKSEAYDIFSNAFVLADASSWREFKSNIKFCRCQ